MIINEKDMRQVKELLKKHNYTVIVQQIDPQTCTVTFPNSSKSLKYEMVKLENHPGILVDEEFLSCPEYALRLLISCDILSKMKKVSIHPLFINYYNKDKQEVSSLSDILRESSSLEERQKEGFLCGIFTKALGADWNKMYEDIAETHGIYTGYRLLKSYF